jgi:hypothetical protein
MIDNEPAPIFLTFPSLESVEGRGTMLLLLTILVIFSGSNFSLGEILLKVALNTKNQTKPTKYL